MMRPARNRSCSQFFMLATARSPSRCSMAEFLDTWSRWSRKLGPPLGWIVTIIIQKRSSPSTSFPVVAIRHVDHDMAWLGAEGILRLKGLLSAQGIPTSPSSRRRGTGNSQVEAFMELPFTCVVHASFTR